ncbi:FMN-linked oxidoreductase [Clavulina sp. PMI_390]|nr:FMN-linked oxidoreductase [Clavulina sp. PMI_390]
MVAIGLLEVTPPFLNSSCPWASDLEQLTQLYSTPFTGAITTRTATKDGFVEDLAIHTVAFSSDTSSSINSYGYSPRPLSEYLSDVKSLLLDVSLPLKPVIISITSSDPIELREMLEDIAKLRDELDPSESFSKPIPLASHLLGVELNTSCPNIPHKPPPAYAIPLLMPLLQILELFQQTLIREGKLPITLGLKLPPYVYAAQIEEVVSAVSGLDKDTVSFFTCTNTLGNSLMFSDQEDRDLAKKKEDAMLASDSGGFALPTIWGGMAGDVIHHLSLGNIKSFSTILSSTPPSDPKLAPKNDIALIGVGGVTSFESAQRMFRAGARAVGCATVLGKEGPGVFKRLQEQH